MNPQGKLFQFNKVHVGVAIKWQTECISELAEIVDVLPPQLIDRMSVVLCILRQCYNAAPMEKATNRDVK